MRVAVILAGGRSVRFGRDKATTRLAGKRLIDHVIARLQGQAQRLLVAGPTDYGTGLACIADGDTGPRGPAAGLWAVCEQLADEQNVADSFVTAPVDTPFLPDDYVGRLAAGKSDAAYARAGGIDHAACAHWPLARLQTVLSAPGSDAPSSLRYLLRQCGAVPVDWSEPECFLNINRPSDLLRAEHRLGSRRPPTSSCDPERHRSR